MTIAAPAFLAPAFRYAGDDWTGANALTYVVYQTPPVYAADGVTIVTQGVPQNLAGYTVTGSLTYQTQCVGAQIPAPVLNLPAPIGAIVNAADGIISLSLAAAQTVFPRQSLALWPKPGAALLIVQPRIVDASSEAVTVGLQQLFVF